MCTIMIVSETASPLSLPTCQASCWRRVSPAVLPEANTRRFSAFVSVALRYLGGRWPRSFAVTSTRRMLSHTSRYFTYAASVAMTSADTTTIEAQPAMVIGRERAGAALPPRRRLQGPVRGAREFLPSLSSEPRITVPGLGSCRSAWDLRGIDRIFPRYPRLTRCRYIGSLAVLSWRHLRVRCTL